MTCGGMLDLQYFNSKGLNCLEMRTGILNLTSDRRKELQTIPFRIFIKNIMPSIFLRLVSVGRFISFKRLVRLNPIENVPTQKVKIFFAFQCVLVIYE